MNQEHSLLILDKFDINETINYSNSNGKTFSKVIRDLLFHVINHSTYHKAQIATEFRQNGLDPYEGFAIHTLTMKKLSDLFRYSGIIKLLSY